MPKDDVFRSSGDALLDPRLCHAVKGDHFVLQQPVGNRHSFLGPKSAGAWSWTLTSI